jgi:predicted GH43/DUF377 family glycosyl hydrolase
MAVKWQKRGRVYVPTGDLWWARSYAVLPTAEVIDQMIRVYFAALDETRYGRIGYVDVRAADPTRIVYVAQEPVLDIGQRGAFDDSGVNPSCVVGVRGRAHLYYIGWQRSERVPYMLFTGLAVADPQRASFRRYSRVPVLDRTGAEPFSRSAPCVICDDGTMKMWYWSCEHWSEEGAWVRYNTVIRYAESTDGVRWIAGGRPCIVPDGPLDYAVGRPWVVRDGDTYKMWYSIRSKAPVSYRIGYAESADGVTWTRKDHEAGIQPSASGWDSEMICYPCVVDAGGHRYMFYNGNRQGSTGFGCAVLES